jgi:beta-lactamase superfamily II metal-dependent hydrolase
LHPAANDRFTQADDAALVLRGDFGPLRLLLLSDLGQEGQERLLSRTPDLRADVAVVGFPRRGEPLVDPLLEAVSPKFVVLAEVPEPMSELRLRKVRERFENNGATVVDTRESGAVTLCVNKGKWILNFAKTHSSPGVRITSTEQSRPGASSPEVQPHP